MKQKFRHIRSHISIVLALLVGIWVLAPRDICITKALVDNDCGCVVTTDNSGCCCCQGAKAGRTLPCSDHSSDTPVSDGDHSSNCLMISSVLAKMNSADRADLALPALDVIAVLPVLPQLQQLLGSSGVSTPYSNTRMDAAGTYRDNCVLLI